ncbi:MAG: Thermophilic serine proteinase precursor [Microgenomates bacterium OLB22]|nr:MAG: Thermophilic serine proteinase precursor [Microgenomates bacterium OLB22]
MRLPGRTESMVEKLKENSAVLGEESYKKVKDELDKLGILRLEVPDGLIEKTIEILEKNSQVVFVERDAIATATAVTNDTDLPKQWGLYAMHVASSTGVSAWDRLPASPAPIQVAVVDTGVDATHPDLQGAIVQQSQFLGQGVPVTDENGHGTHIAGIIGARGNNGQGIAGVDYVTQLMNVKVLDASGNGYYSSIAAGVMWAADNGAEVINLSLGAPYDSPSLKEAIDYAWSKGAVIVAAAGNNGASGALYPARYDHVIGVGAIDENLHRSSYTNTGIGVDLAAPGDKIFSTRKGGGYVTMTGTSMASANVAGIAALILQTGYCTTRDCTYEALQGHGVPIEGTGSLWALGMADGAFLYASLTPTPTASPSPSLSPMPSITPSLTPTATPSPSPITTPTGTPTSGSNATMTVSTLSAEVKRWFFSSSLLVNATVQDGASSPVSKATVSIEVKSPSGKLFQGKATTNNKGSVVFGMTSLKERGTYLVTITAVQKTGYTYTQSPLMSTSATF